MVIVDSSVWIEGLRKHGRLDVKVALEGLLDAYEAQLCAPVRLEVLGGARASERGSIGHYFSILPYRPTRPEDWENGIRLAWTLRDNGLTVPWFDVLIAAIAKQEGVRVYAIDQHFARISELTGLQLYSPGYGGKFMP